MKRWSGEGVGDRRQADEREAHCRQTEQKVQRKTQGPGAGSSV